MFKCKLVILVEVLLSLVSSVLSREEPLPPNLFLQGALSFALHWQSWYIRFIIFTRQVCDLFF